MIELVNTQDIDRIWAIAGPMVSRCLEKAPMEISAGDIWGNVRSGQWQLLIAHDGKPQGVTVWRSSANGYYDCVLLTGEDLDSWLPDLIEMATFLAKTNGCKGLAATGRRGLIKSLKKNLPGLKVMRVTYAAEF